MTANVEDPHKDCKYLGNDAWDCGHLDNSENCDCHVCAEAEAQGKDTMTAYEVWKSEWPRILAASAFAAVAVGGFVWLWLALGVAP